MTGLIESVTAALQGLGVHVVRAWPQAPVALPSCTVSVLDDRVGEDGRREAAVALTLRAQMPEEADLLSHQADQLLQAQGWRRAGCRDGAERDGSCFHKALRYEAAFPQAETFPLTAAGTAYTATVLKMAWERPLSDRTTLSDTVSRLAPAGPHRQQVRLRIAHEKPGEVAARLLTGPITGLGGGWLATAITQHAAGAEATLARVQ